MEPHEQARHAAAENGPDATPALDQETSLFVGNKADYYAGKWRARDKQGRPASSWNGAACLLGPVWLAYRKMYWQAVVFLVVSLLLQVTLGLLNDVVGELLSYALPVALGFHGNTLYRDHVRRKIADMRDQGLSGNAFDAALPLRGGTNPAAAWIVAAVMTVVLVLSAVAMIG